MLCLENSNVGNNNVLAFVLLLVLFSGVCPGFPWGLDRSLFRISPGFESLFCCSSVFFTPPLYLCEEMFNSTEKKSYDDRRFVFQWVMLVKQSVTIYAGLFPVNLNVDAAISFHVHQIF